jgi:uncharacterized protein YigE (DUF2233 family)
MGYKGIFAFLEKMKKTGLVSSIFFITGLTITFFVFGQSQPQTTRADLLTYIADPAKQDLQFFWKDPAGNPYTNIQNLKDDLQRKGHDLRFAMNGGMFTKTLDPVGLYIENGIVLKALNTVQSAYGNFYLQPNGVFYLTRGGKAVILPSTRFKQTGDIQYATQSGPMLLINGAIHSAFRKGSTNLNVRNGVGILPDGRILFAMSKEKINFFDFATFFKSQGCQNALYLDGVISKTYLPEENWMQLDGPLGIMMGEVKAAKP